MKPARRRWQVALFASLGGLARADGLFLDLDARRFPVEYAPSTLKVDDFNRDRRPDIAVAHGGDGRISVLLQKPDSSLGSPALYSVGLSPVHVTSGDLNGDGAPEIVVVSSGSAALSVLLNRGDGTFEDARSVELSEDPRASELADLDRDGVLDVITTTNFRSAANPGFFSVFKGNGKGGLRETGRFTIGDNPHYLVVADFDGDAIIDVAINHTLAVSWFRGRGDGVFDSLIRTDLSPSIPRFIAGGDFNRDGRLDLATVTDTPDLQVLEGAAGGKFKPRGIPAATRPGVPVVVKDLDGDDTLDLVVHSTLGGGSMLQFLRGAGDGAFALLEEVPFDMNDFTVEDFDGDGILDVIGGVTGPNGVVIIRGAGPGRLNSGDVFRLDFTPRNLLLADADGDAHVDLVAQGATGLDVLLSHGRDGIASPVSSLVSGAIEDAVAADMDRDGRTEVALADIAGARVVVGRFDGAGRWSALFEHAAGVLPWRLVAADFDGDGLADLAVTDRASKMATVLLAPASWNEPRRLGLELGDPQTAIAAGDLDGDAHPDLAVATRTGLQILLGDGRGGFASPFPVSVLESASALRVADVDADGFADVASFKPDGDGIVVVYAAAIPGSRRVEAAAGASSLRAIDVIDADGDGRLDLAAAVAMPFGAAAVWRGIEGGGFAEPDLYRVGSDPASLVFADFDEDGRIDLAAADRAGSGVIVLSGRSDTRPISQFRRGDVNLDGKVNLSDAGLILARLFRGGDRYTCEDTADADDDGRLSITDAIFVLLNRFQGGPAPPDPGPTDCGPDPTQDALFHCNENCF